MSSLKCELWDFPRFYFELLKTNAARSMSMVILSVLPALPYA